MKDCGGFSRFLRENKSTPDANYVRDCKQRRAAARFLTQNDPPVMLQK
jgi:hypothetical protein